MDTYFFLGNIIKKENEIYTLLLYDGTVINNVDLEIISQMDIEKAGK